MSAWAHWFVAQPPDQHVAPELRYLLLALAALWVVLAWGGRRVPTLAGGLVFFSVACGVWALAFARPYGLLEAPVPTSEALFAGLAARGDARSFVAGEPYLGGAWARLVRLGLAPETLGVARNLMPLLVLPGLALALAFVWRRPSALVAAVGLLAFGGTDLEALGGFGLVSDLWLHPAAGLALLPLTLAALLAEQEGGRRWLAVPLIVLGVGLCSAPIHEPLPPRAWIGALLLDPWPWPLLAGLGLAQGAGRAASGLLAAGLALLVASAAGAPLDAWAGTGLWRLGLLLGASVPLEQALRWLRTQLVARWPTWPVGQGAGLALWLALLLPGSFLFWWSPPSLSDVAHASLVPVPKELIDAARELRRLTPEDAVVVASARHAAAVALYGERRLLRAPALVAASDDRERRLLERSIFVDGRPRRRLAARFGVTHVFTGPGDDWPAGLVDGGLRLLGEKPPGYRIYAIGG